MAHPRPRSACGAVGAPALGPPNGARRCRVPGRRCRSPSVPSAQCSSWSTTGRRPATPCSTSSRGLQGPDPLAPITVAVPSPLAGLGLRRAAAARAGFANVRFTALARLAELLGAPRLAAAGRRPLTPAARTEAIHAALVADDGPLRPVAGHPATAAALATTFDDLQALDEAALDALAAVDGARSRAATIVRLFRATAARTADCYDADAVARAAAETIAEGGQAAAEVGHVVLHLPKALLPGEAVLLRALAARDRLTVLLGRTGDPAVDAVHTGALVARLRDVVGAPSSPRAPEAAPTAERIISAPDPEDEVRAVARDLQERAKGGTSLGRIAIVARLGDPYGRLVPEVLEAADIPWTGSAPRRLAESAPGRVLLGLLALPDDQLARDEVTAWLASGPVLDPETGRRVNAARWDVLSREAGVVRGPSQWVARLEVHRQAIAEELAARSAARDDAEWQLERLAASANEAAALAVFVAGLAEALRAPSTPTWHAHTAWARELLVRYLGDERRRAAWPETELDAARRIEAVLDELSGLDAVGSPVDLERFRRSLGAELAARVGRIGTFGSAVLVGSLDQAYAGDFDVVYVLGAVEGALPPRGREDPLLPDRDRRAIGDLAPHAARRLEERRDYLAALAAATERVLVFPRADARAQRKRLPAQWVLESARALGATDVTAERLRDATTEPWLEVVPSFDGLVARGDPGSDTEYLLRSLSAQRGAGAAIESHPLAQDGLARGAPAALARRSRGRRRSPASSGRSPTSLPARRVPRRRRRCRTGRRARSGTSSDVCCACATCPGRRPPRRSARSTRAR